MRTWQFGIFDTQFADWELDIISGKSILVYGNASNLVGTTYTDPTLITDCDIGGVTGDNVWYKGLHKIAIEQIRAKLGQLPVLVRVTFDPMYYYGGSSATIRRYIYRMLSTWDHGDVSNRYRDVSGLTTWYEDAYAPYPGQDVVATAAYDSGASETFDSGDNLVRFPMEITSIVERALRDNIAIAFLFWTKGDTAAQWFFADAVTNRRPRLTFYYVYPVEFYPDDGSGNLDYSAAVDDSEANVYYIGAVERGETGTAKALHVRNYSGDTQHVEIFDDHPEWEDPIQRSGSGTGSLDYVQLLDAAVSQRYTVTFYSDTEYEVKAEAYRDNTTSLHASITGDASWRGTISTLFTAPSGGLKIPAAAWQPGVLNGDEWEVVVRGNTTDTDWPTDSNSQVEMTPDDGGTPLTTGWRTIKGRRIQTRASVDVDGATKLFPTRYVVPTDWVVGSPAFVQDDTNIDEGTISSIQEAAIGTDTFSGTGLDDLIASGNYNGNGDRTYQVEIDAASTPDTFKWSNDGGSTWEATGVAITGSTQLLEDGVYVTFGATTGHTATDYWQFAATCYGVTLTGLTPGSNTYASGSIIGTTLPIRGMATAIYSTVSAASGDSQPVPSRLYVTDASVFTQGQTIIVQAIGSTDYEEAVIATGGVSVSGGYLTLTAGLTGDYDEGDFVTVKGVGEEMIWLRPVADSGTDEELKQFRLNARLL